MCSCACQTPLQPPWPFSLCYISSRERERAQERTVGLRRRRAWWPLNLPLLLLCFESSSSSFIQQKQQQWRSVYPKTQLWWPEEWRRRGEEGSLCWDWAFGASPSFRPLTFAIAVQEHQQQRVLFFYYSPHIHRLLQFRKLHVDVRLRRLGWEGGGQRPKSLEREQGRRKETPLKSSSFDTKLWLRSHVCPSVVHSFLEEEEKRRERILSELIRGHHHHIFQESHHLLLRWQRPWQEEKENKNVMEFSKQRSSLQKVHRSTIRLCCRQATGSTKLLLMVSHTTTTKKSTPLWGETEKGEPRKKEIDKNNNQPRRDDDVAAGSSLWIILNSF